MKRWKTGLTALAAGALSLVASPAFAAHVTLHDPAGDAADPGLDITAATLHNEDHAVVVRVRFVKSVHGDLIVSVDPRGGRGVRLVSEYHPVRHTTNLVVAGAFSDRHVSHEPRRVSCRGFRVHWSTEAPVARLRMPSRCLDDGDYGAVRFAVLTERGADTDYAPGSHGSSAWIPRG